MTRPTSDRVREAIFNMLAGEVPGSKVMDLFAGTGALGIEAISRGAQTALFIEQNESALRCLIQNIKHTKLETRCRVMGGDVFVSLARLDRSDTFDLVFADPPYRQGLAERLLRVLDARVVMEGWLVLETATGEILPERCGHFAVKKKRIYGDTTVWIYRAGKNAGGGRPSDGDL